jgi:signal transduction histidine kinase
MSLRTKILAAIVGLNLVVLVLGVALLLLRPGTRSGARVPEAILSPLGRAIAYEPPPSTARLDALRSLESAPGVESVVLLEDSPVVREPPTRRDFGGRATPPADVARAQALYANARRVRRLQVGDRELATLLEAKEASEPLRQGVYVRWAPAGSDVERARDLYLVVLGGLALATVVAWWLLSRLVVRPLASLATAADRVAEGDWSVRVAASGAEDEIARTATAFNRMATEVGEYQAQLESRVLEALQRVRKAEERLAIAQRLAATGKLASGIAHEINNPLGGMRNAVRALGRGDLDAQKTAEYLDLVLDGLARIEDTVKKVLSFTPRSAKPRPVVMTEVVQKAIALARHRLERKGVALEAKIEGNLTVRVFGDPHELQQVVLNLLLNSADAIPDPGTPGRNAGRIEVEVREEGDLVLLLVRDDGAGMSPEVAAQCFDFFFTTKDPGEGTGLGLAVVHNIVSNHGGRIEVESAVGQGTTFRVWLPKDTGAAEAPTPVETEPAKR